MQQRGVGVARGELVPHGEHVYKPCWVLPLAFGGLPETLTIFKCAVLALVLNQLNNLQTVCQVVNSRQCTLSP